MAEPPEPDDLGAAPGVGDADRRHLAAAIDLSRRCPPSDTAFSVGAVIVARDGAVMATGYSREDGDRGHAEEIALAKLPPGDSRLATATLYSSLEPCGERASRPRTCTELVLAAGVPRVVIAWREPAVFVDADGSARLRAAGVEVVELADLADAARQVNAHLL
jgi:diaminohydroxyphosphoribosylaminopyrimidine deaminase / 5-amino-6-(5-phosphoribosylamino)uracil reductase